MGKVRDLSDAVTRNRLAFSIVTVSVVGITVIAVAVIALAGSKRPEMSRLVFSSVLPLFGTWVGTVLAFYFARDNLQAATESTLKLSAAGETATPVATVMIPETDWVAYEVADRDAANDVALADLRAKMRELQPPSRRLPIRTAAGVVLYVLHDSTLTAFAEEHEAEAGTLARTFGDLLSEPKYRELVTAIGFVSAQATVADARGVMAKIKNCNDIFVTPAGTQDEHAIGWLTNTLLAGVQ